MPKLIAWRIDKEKWAADSFSGAGAAVDGGRWNSTGIRVVYTSSSLALAAYEKYVHLPKPVSPKSHFVRFKLEFDDTLVSRLEDANLPAGWKVFPPPKSTQALGDAWIGAGSTVVLAVPSALIHEEINFLLNPAHPDFSKITILPKQTFAFADRIARFVDPAP
jgi:RES domain-containing protein